MNSYIIGQAITCVLIIVGFFYNRYLVQRAAKNLAVVVALEKERMDVRIKSLEKQVNGK